ncbi:hypothetical protein [Alteromonas sp. ASW11-130]|uniref:hypothetical protein n=1 Tax=Alteromonas sp. ASW11-130 TaxID=3015775 RepID=UPI00224271A0|nr:hypothetical protein [Alteromonas sp. ASW11-130]MCW8092502.1 hypothetical protein [Alteromonas sp. ASW11-130]
MSLKKIVRSTTFLATFFCTSTAFSAESSVTGEYKVVYGHVKTMEVSNPVAGESPEQIGRFSVWLVKANWKNLSAEEKMRSKYIIRLRGTLRGLVNPRDFTARHIMVGDNRDYVIRSDGDQLIPISGDPFCSSGEPMQVKEQVNLVSASGIYGNLTSGTIMLEGQVNNCPHLEGFGKNDFTVIPNQGIVIFD